MKKHLVPARAGWIFLTVFLLGPARATRADGPGAANTWALLVGVSKYQNEQIVASLRFPALDATSFRDVLVDPQIGGIPKDHVVLLTDDAATRSGIDAAFDKTLTANVKPGDRVIIFLAGHGVAKGVGPEAKGFFLTTDVSGLTTPALTDSALSLRTFADKLGKLPAAEFILFVDACREDPTPGRGVKPNQMSDVIGRGLQIVPQDTQKPATVTTFYACSIGQRAYEDIKLKHGVFTYWVLDGLRQGPVPQQGDGSVYMNRLATYTRVKVGDWASKTFGTARGAKLATAADDDEVVTQTPEVVSLVAPNQSAQTQSVVLMKVKRPVAEVPIQPDAPRLMVTTVPEGAQVSINGKLVGTAPINDDLPAGNCVVKVEAPGYVSEERTVKAVDGYQLQFALALKPGGDGAGAALKGESATNYQRAVDAEAHGDTEVAMAGYNIVRQSDPKFAPAYLRLANLQRSTGAKTEANATLVDLVGQVPSAANYSVLSRSYSALVDKSVVPVAEAPPDDSKKSSGLGGLFGKKKKKADAPAAAVDPNATLALDAADKALKLDSKWADAHLARGFALVAADQHGERQAEAQSELGTAAFMAPNDAATHYGLGYGRRIFAVLKDDAGRNADLKSAITAQEEALALRPDYYEAHLEEAYCYHLMGDNDHAMRQYELANANRGAASDKDEVAASNVALSALHREQAQKSTGDDKASQEKEAQGYQADGEEISPNLSRAMSLLGQVGLRTRLVDFLPTSVGRWMDPKAVVQSQIRGKLPNISIPGFP